MYCTNAIVQVAVINLEEKAPRDRSVIDPNRSRSVHAVANVETAMLAELNAIVSGLFVIRNEEKSPSIAATTIAASPSKSSNAKKMKISEIEMYESNLKN